jgi:hypothetical protein
MNDPEATTTDPGGNHHTATNHPLWRALRSFNFDGPDTRLTFVRRLARDNGWAPDFASRVVEEYRRFLFLSQVAGHPVTPSDEVDQAWHLHLVYTRSYWEDLCGKVLGKPLHHGPTRGGQKEDGKFADWYERTRASYGNWFGERPPADIWPESTVRFSRPATIRRVSTLDFWLLPRPALRQAGAMAALTAVLCLTTGFVAELTTGEWVGVIVLALLLMLVLITACRRRRGGKRGDGGTGCSGWFGCGSSGCGGGCGGGGD